MLATREERVKAIEESATSLGRKMQGAFGSGSSLQALGGQESEEEIQDLLAELGF
jgi:hypothetical protein